MGIPDVGRDHRARSFGSIARAYHRHRPGYPAAALDWALAPVAAAAADRTLLDLGAGTGKLAADLVGRAASVIAVEPDPGMLEVLREGLPGVTALAGSAERVPLPDASVDGVLVGQAYHWFDPEPATAEMARVLRPGGVLALLWNGEDREVDWVRGYYDVVGRPAPSTPPGRPADPRHGGPAEHPGLGPVETAVFDNAQPTTTVALLDTLATYSWVSTRPPAARERTLREARAYLARHPATRDGQFTVPLRTEVLRAARR